MADVVDLIRAAHRQIDELLEQAENSEPDHMVGILQQVAELLRPHSEAEESFVYPAIRQYDTQEDDEVKDGVAEHHHIEGLLEQLLTEDPSGPGYDGKLAAMIGELRHHVEEEEQDLLPVLIEKAGDEQREELGVRFAEVTGLTMDGKDEARPSSRQGQSQKAEPRNGDLGEAGGATRADLYEEAKEKEIPGRSNMSKEELARAVEES
ncbi:MAG TPA: hemerythrin domain-containing protein [Kineosporiaceae bacterium]